jgi:hypothetical protein
VMRHSHVGRMSYFHFTAVNRPMSFAHACQRILDAGVDHL